MKPSPQHISYAIALVGALFGMAGGYFRLTTPEAAECQVGLADKTARLELTEKAADACGKALELCAGGSK